MERIGLVHDPSRDFDHPRVDAEAYPHLVAACVLRAGARRVACGAHALMTETMISSSRSRAAGLDDAGGVELGQRLVAVAARLVAGVLAGAGPLEDGDDLGAPRPASGSASA